VAAYCGICPLDLLGQAQSSATAVKVGKTLVVIFLRGGTDGLNLVVPYGEKAYYEARKTLAIAKPGSPEGALDLDGFFGLHPAAQALNPLFAQGKAMALHAVGYSQNTRSHFEEQDVWETGVIGNTISSDGWLNRHLLSSQGHGPIRAISIGDSLPRILRGQAPAYAVRGISELTLPERGGNADITAALEHAYHSPSPAMEGMQADANDLLAQTGRTTLEGVKILKTIAAQPYEPGAVYPETGLAKRLKEVARLIKADIGLEVAEVDFGGWDTHNNQGGFQGAFADRVRELSEAMAAFHADMGSRMDNVLLMTLSDFGRTVAENGSRGTDHGWANCLLAMGGPVLQGSAGKPRPVLTDWPGLAEEQLQDKRDLKHTTDFRDVLAEVVTQHLGNPLLEKILPTHTFKPVGLLSPAAA
jgi:uncharacterized protein (DUF1501 family)